jgi:hypothetical protein
MLFQSAIESELVDELAQHLINGREALSLFDPGSTLRRLAARLRTRQFLRIIRISSAYAALIHGFSDRVKEVLVSIARK